MRTGEQHLMCKTKSAASLRCGETVQSLKDPSRALLRLGLTVSTQFALSDTTNKTDQILQSWTGPRELEGALLAWLLSAALPYRLS